MKNVLDKLNKAFENRVRLATMSLLMVNDKLEFNTLKTELNVTDGNLASHLSALEKAGYIAVIKKFVGKKPNTSYSITKIGESAFREHLDALETLLNNNN